MTRALLLAIALLGCGGGGRAAPAPITADKDSGAPTRDHVVTPDELLVGGANATSQRAMVGHVGRVYFERTQSPAAESDWADQADVYAVADIGDGQVRVLLDEYTYRLLLWVDEADLRPVVVYETDLSLHPGAAPRVRGEPGVTIAVGTPFVEDTAASAEEHRQVTIDDYGTVRVSGYLPKDAIGRFWSAVAIPETVRAAHTIPRGTVLRAAPDPAAAELATALYDIHVRVDDAARDGWVEIQTLGPQVFAHGFVRDEELTEVPEVDVGHGVGTGGSWASSGTVPLELPAGTCLHDAADGAIIGRTMIAQTWKVRRGDDSGWIRVLIHSPLGTIEVPAQDPAAGGEPACGT